MATPEHGEKIIDPIHQFVINRIIPIDIGGLDISFTNSALWAVIAVTCASLLFILAPRNLIPTRLQSVAESIYEVVDNMTHEVLHENARTYFPFVLTSPAAITSRKSLPAAPSAKSCRTCSISSRTWPA